MFVEDFSIPQEMINDAIKYILVLVLLCILSAAISKWREQRRLNKEFAAYQQRRLDEEQEAE